MNSSRTVTTQCTITIDNGVQETVPFDVMTSKHNTFDVNPALTHAMSNPDIAEQCLNRQPKTTVQITVYVHNPTSYQVWIVGRGRFCTFELGVYQF